MPKLNSLEVVHQDTNKDSYENLHDIIISLKGARNQEVVDGEARALYEALLEMYVNDKEAFARRIETLQAEFGSSLAQVIEEMIAYANASEAYAKKITMVNAELATNNAMVRQETSARVTGDEALASQITTLSATVGSKNRTYYQSSAPTSGMVSGDLWIDSDDDKLYRYNGSSWVNIQDNQIGVNTAAISNEATTRATADSANATAIDAVTARLDTGDFASVKESAEASAQRLTTRINLTTEITNWSLFGGLSLNTGTTWGLVALGTGSGTYVADSPFFPVDAGKTYTITGDSLNYNSSGYVAFQIVFYDAGGTALKIGASNPIYGSHGFDSGDLNRNQHAVADTAPAGATQAKARFLVVNGAGAQVGFRQVKVELGGLPATNFSQETTVNYTSAKWGVTVNANNQVAGISLLADSTGTSEFLVAANKFRVKKPDGSDGISWNGTNSRLDISGDVYANSFYGNVVGTGNINNNAVTQSFFTAGPIYDVTLNFTITGNAGDMYSVYIIATWVQSYLATTELYLDGTVVRAEGPVAGSIGTLAHSTSLGVGSHSARIVSWDNRNNNGTGIYILVTKR